MRILSPLFILVSLVGCADSTANRATGAGEERPNFILIVIDALRRDHLGSYGYPEPTSPFTDSLAADGVLFESAYSHGSQTFNSTASLLTSRYFPFLIPRPEEWGPISGLPGEAAKRHAKAPLLVEENLTLAEALGSAGYQTLGLFTNPHHHSTSGFWQGFEVSRYLFPKKGSLPYARGGQVHEAFFHWFDNERRDGPFLAYLHFMDVHNPYRPPQFLRKEFVQSEGRDLYLNGIPDPEKTPAPDDLAFMIALYDAEIRFVDLVLENLVNDLRDRDALKNTFIIVTSDHGDEFMDRGGLGHGMHLGPEMVRIPMLVVGPRVGARRETALTRQLDLAPTITDLAGIDTPEAFEGVSLVPLLQGGPSTGPEGLTSFAWVGEQRSLSTLKWHFTRGLQEGSARLYDLEADPRGHRDVSEVHPQLVASFGEQLEALEARRWASASKSRQLALEDTLPPIDEKTQDQLRALGYIDD